MVGRDERADVLAGLAAELSNSEDEAVTTQAIVEQAVELFSDAQYASLTVKASKRPSFRTLASTSSLSTDLDRRQYELDEGPCIESTTLGEWFRSGDLARDNRWPRWGPIAADAGVQSLLSVRLLSKGEPFGALNLYAEPGGAFADPDDVELALLFTVHAAAALVSARLVTNLETAMSSRHDIGIAQGILMGRYGISSAQAFSALRRISQHHNIKLREVAREVIQSRQLPAEAPPWPGPVPAAGREVDDTTDGTHV